MSRLKTILCLTLLVSIILTGCTGSQSASKAVASEDVPKAEVLIVVEVPSVTTSPGTVILNVLDEVTGLALNPSTFKMQKRDDTHFSLAIPVNLGTVLKYRYSRSDAIPVMEASTLGEDIRYRLAVVDAPMTIYDTVAAWGDYPYQGKTGKIVGSILDVTTNTPVPNIMINAGGLTAYSASDGSFIINDLPDGTHNLVAYAPDGSYLPFQQGATIEGGLTTPADIRIVPGQPVNLTFLLNAPAEYAGLPIRLAGSITQLGNTFADLSGGTSAVASLMPILAGLEDGRRYVTISVSSGTYIEYKYTLGDGFWNSELDKDGWFKLRSVVVPAVDTIIQDEVTSFTAQGTQPVSFDVAVPDDPLELDRVSIQLNPYGWMEPIPMWPAADNHWKFTVYSPLNLAGNFSYRYCRNEQCGVADDVVTAGLDSSGRNLPPDTKSIQDTVTSWVALDKTAALILNDAVIPYGPGYVTGIEFSPEYQPDWAPHLNSAIKEVMATGANSLVLTPSWTCSDPISSYCDYSPALNTSWKETYEQIWQAQQAGLSVFLAPDLRFTSTDSWWQAATHDADWWTRWYAGYKRYITHFADLAQQSGVKYLVIGGRSNAPSLPGGLLPDGNSANTPANSIVIWTDILNAIRSHYSGAIVWELNYPGSLETPPAFLNAVDALYVTIEGPIVTSTAPDITELQDGFAGIIDTAVYPLIEQYGKPVYIGIDYPSSVGSATGCLISVSEPCGTVDLEIQTEVYRAALTVVNYRNWLSGFISRGFYPPARLTDGSGSIHGKPAQDLLGYWFPYINGTP